MCAPQGGQVLEWVFKRTLPEKLCSRGFKKRESQSLLKPQEIALLVFLQFQ